MIHIDVDAPKKVFNASGCGTADDMAAELSAAVRAIYIMMQGSGQGVGDDFKEALQHMLRDGAPAWEDSTIIHNGYGHCVTGLPPEEGA